MTDTVPSFDAVVAAVQARAWYLRCHGPDAGADTGGWVAADRLIAGGGPLAGLVARTGQARGADRASVAAALFVQAYTFQVSGVAVAAWALGLPAPTLDPGQVRVRVGRERPDDLAVATEALTAHGAPTLAAALIDGHLEPLVAAVRRAVRVGERALWGNVAAMVAAVLRAVDQPGADGDPAVRARAAGPTPATATATATGAGAGSAAAAACGSGPVRRPGGSAWTARWVDLTGAATMPVGSTRPPEGPGSVVPSARTDWWPRRVGLRVADRWSDPIKLERFNLGRASPEPQSYAHARRARVQRRRARSEGAGRRWLRAGPPAPRMRR